MLGNSWFKKKKPFLGLTGMGGGAGGYLVGGGGPVEVTGGTTTAEGIVPGNGYRYHVFMTDPSPQTFVIPQSRGSLDCEFLIIGGGGSGGYDVGGGGGAGGMVHGQPYTIPSGTHPVSVGEGGVQSPTSPTPDPLRGGPGLSGNPSVVVLDGVTITGLGGGGAGGWSNSSPPRSGAGGGSGGGGCGYTTSANGGGGNQPAQNPGVSNITNYGTGGGATNNPAPGQKGGGGGGTGGAGSGPPGSGGLAQALPAFAAPLVSPEIPAPSRSAFVTTVDPNGYYGFGGYGSADSDPNPSNPAPRAAINGTGNGGGGGGAPPGIGDKGADGIIIFRYFA